jgi:hypothetical protein
VDLPDQLRQLTIRLRRASCLRQEKPGHPAAGTGRANASTDAR